MKTDYIQNLRTAKVEMINGAPALTVDGRPIPQMAYQWRLGMRIDDDPAHDSKWMVENMMKAGVELFFTRFSMDDPAKFDFYYDIFIQQMELLTSLKPDVLVMPWIQISPYASFADKYPDDVIHFENGTNNAWNSARATGLPTPDCPRFSFASAAWRSEVGVMLRELIKRLCSSKYARNIIGYFFFCFDQEFSYFFEFDALEHCIDFSPAMKKAFRNYLADKYRGDERLLQKAWNQEHVTFETAQIPSLSQRTTGDFGYFRDPSRSMQVYDYVACHNEQTADAFMHLSRVCKEASGSRHAVGAFWGYLMNQDIQMGGQTQFKKILDCPYIDFWSSPFSYENRCAGNFASLRMALKSLHKHGKMYFAETDTFVSDTPRSALDAHCYPDQTVEEDKAMILRDFVYPFCEGDNGWWIDWCAGPSQYKEDGLRPEMIKLRKVSQDSFSYPRGPVSDIAAVIDQESLHTPACNSRNHDDHRSLTPALLLMQHSLDRFRIDELPRLGTPVDFYETDDVIAADARKYRMYIFLNQYMADDRERERIEKELKKDGNVLVWMYGAGLINPDAACGDTLSLEHASELTGIRLAAQMRETRCVMTAVSNPLLPSLQEGEKLGDYLRERILRVPDPDSNVTAMVVPIDRFPEPNMVNPLIYVDDPDAVSLAYFDDGGKVGLAVKQFADWTSVYVGAPCLQAHVLRDLAKLANAHLYVDGEEIVYANESYIGIHTAVGGKRTICLKETACVEEVFQDRLIAEHAQTFEEDIPAHTTRLYRIR
ncbi:MAG: hypothetical protein IKC46_13075 [Lachnospiraceae bacterium]|nr:hypothetical protein [Lachnospiraceae bacterium]